MNEFLHIPEPTLLFGHNQAMEDPRDGLTLFSTFDRGKVHGIRAGVIGTKDGIRRYKNWVTRIQSPIYDLDKHGQSQIHRPFFPGFEAVFNIPWDPEPVLEIVIPDGELEKYVYLDDRYKRVYETVEVYSERILRSHRQEEITPDLWFVILPELVWQKCRPKSTIESAKRLTAENKQKPKAAQSLLEAPSLFEDVNLAATPYHYEVHFHNQLKARLLEKQFLTQIIRETTIAPDDFLDQFGCRQRDVDTPSAIAWNLSTAVFYKAGGRPWKINQIREGVCYIGLVFKQNERDPDHSSSCCAAQMFLDSGDGVVFKGAVGPWRTSARGDYHLSTQAAKKLIGLAMDSYKAHFKEPPREMFLHGKVQFNDAEWDGFKSAIDARTTLVGVRIKHESFLKLFSKGTHPVMRGLAPIRSRWTSYL